MSGARGERRTNILTFTTIYVATLILAGLTVWGVFAWCDANVAEVQDQLLYEKRYSQACFSKGRWVRKYDQKTGNSTYTFLPPEPTWQGPTKVGVR